MARFVLIAAAAFAFLLTICLANMIVPLFAIFARPKSKQGSARVQPLLPNPNWRAKKQGVPTMGGLCIVFATVLASVLAQVGLAMVEPAIFMEDWAVRVQLAVIVAFTFALIGFLDDMAGLLRHQPAGLPVVVKLLAQAGASLWVLMLFARNGMLSSTVLLPAIGLVDFGQAIYPIMFVLMVFFIHAVSLTDRVDGICASCTFVSLLGFMSFAVLLNRFEVALFPAALAGSLVSFLLWNFHPAKIHLGSIGNLFLAGALFGIAQSLNWVGLWLLLSLPYWVQGSIALLQFISVGLFKKKLFPAPTLDGILLHRGWSHTAIICAFMGMSIAGFLFAFMFMRLSI